jgi:hypothetical protein
VSNESKCLPSTPLKLRSGLVLKATNRAPASPDEVAKDGTAAIEVEFASSRDGNCTAPIAAVGTDTAERTIGDVAGARHGQFKRRGKSPCSIITAPT